jgi:hypothetical protein
MSAWDWIKKATKDSGEWLGNAGEDVVNWSLDRVEQGDSLLGPTVGQIRDKLGRGSDAPGLSTTVPLPSVYGGSGGASTLSDAWYGGSNDPYNQAAEARRQLAAIGLDPSGLDWAFGAPRAGGIYGDLQQGRLAAEGQIQGNINTFQSSIDRQLADLGSVFAAANAGDRAAADAAISAIQGIELGPLSLASSNPADVARQQQAYGMLMGAATGQLDAHTNPEDLAAQTKARDLLWELGSSPELTAQERFIYEKQRLVEEQDRRGAMMAAMRNLASRGQLGSGAEIGAMLGAQQTTSQNRLLGDLGALANAVDRQMNSLNQYRTLATDMRNASDAMTSGNMNRRLGGMQGASQAANAMRAASDDIAMFNSGQTNDYNDALANLQFRQATAPFDIERTTSAASSGRALQQADLGTRAAGTVLTAQNTIPTLRYGAADSDARVALGLAESDLANRRWEIERTDRNAQAARANEISLETARQMREQAAKSGGGILGGKLNFL